MVVVGGFMWRTLPNFWLNVMVRLRCFSLNAFLFVFLENLVLICEFCFSSWLDRLDQLDMQGGRDPFFDPFSNFGSFGGQRSLLPSFFGGRNPFDDPFFRTPFGHDPFFASPFGNDPFFASPFGNMLNSSVFGPRPPFIDPQTSGLLENQASQPNRSRGPIIEELNSDDEKEEKEAPVEQKENPRKHGRSSKDPVVEDPDDEAEGEVYMSLSLSFPITCAICRY